MTLTNSMNAARKSAETCSRCLSRAFSRERVRRIELPYSAWEADVLPLNYTREVLGDPSKRHGQPLSEGAVSA